MGLLDTFSLTNSQRSGYVPTQGGNLSIPQFVGSPSPAVAQVPVMPYFGTGASNFSGFNPNAFANITSKPLLPTRNQDQQALSLQAGCAGGTLDLVG